jgi:ATP-dependent helicase HepA
MNANSLIGIVLINREFGYCKIVSHENQRIKIHFCGTQRESWYSNSVLRTDFEWTPMSVGLKCRVNDKGICTVISPSIKVNEMSGVHEYLVEFDDESGEKIYVGERDLWPIPDSLVETPRTQISSLKPEAFHSWRSREFFQRALINLQKETCGIYALASSRIELMPHQAFVVGTVVDDISWRYILADEVGLGKTVEAGVIAHQLLAEKPDARILILCPGPLSRQWLVEMHVSFGGRDFHLLDLHNPVNVDLNNWSRVICSLKLATRDYMNKIISVNWDLIIIDEAHHLIWNHEQYKLVQKLSTQIPRILLLSAVPARSREKELLKLLQLVEPDRYSDNSVIAEKFSELYALQSSIGRRIRILSRYLDRGISDEESLEIIHESADKLFALEILCDDTDLLTAYTKIKEIHDYQEITIRYQNLIDVVIARYRINRRILKNRRSHLIDNSFMVRVPRLFDISTFAPSPLELQVTNLTVDLLLSIKENISIELFQSIVRLTMQSLCDPVALYGLMIALSFEEDAVDQSNVFLDSNLIYDYEERDQVIEAIAAKLGRHLDRGILKRLIELLKLSIDTESSSRLNKLIEVVKSQDEYKLKKQIIFAGTYGTAEYISYELIKIFGKNSVATFTHDLSDDEKEQEVTKFKRNSDCFLLISDESGGEGRNFQFADQIIHYDLPWSVASVEQRIGRLDRIGRSRAVKSIVIVPDNSLERDWLSCLELGFSVFTESISGLEFMLRGTEKNIICSLFGRDSNSLEQLIQSIKSDCDTEKSTDDADALTDATSFKKTSHYLKALSATSDHELEDSFPNFFRIISRPESAKKVTDRKDLNLNIWRFKPGDVSQFNLVGLEKLGDKELHERYGTFSRTVARDRPDLEFFSIGHPLIDSVSALTSLVAKGRTFAIKIKSSHLVKAGHYFLVKWKFTSSIDDESDQTNKVDRLLSLRNVFTIFDINSEEQISELVSDEMYKVIHSNLGVQNLNLEVLIDELGQLTEDWGPLVSVLLKKSECSAKTLYEIKYKSLDDQLILEFKDSIEKFSLSVLEDQEQLASQFDTYIKCFAKISPIIDSIGIIVVGKA